jgi:hypothetical protein
MALVLYGLPDAFSRYVVVTAFFAERLPAAPCATVGANRRSAIGAFGHSVIVARRTYVAFAIHMLDLAVSVHAALLSLSGLAANSRTRSRLHSHEVLW